METEENEESDNITKTGILQVLTLFGLFNGGLALLFLSTFEVIPPFFLMGVPPLLIASFILASKWGGSVGFWFLGLNMLVLIWAGCPFLLAWVVSIGLTKIHWNPIIAWIAIPIVYFGIMGYWFTRKTESGK